MDTVKLNNGLEVVARKSNYAKSGLTAITYANKTQAYNKAEKLGPEYTVFGFRPFYVGRVNQ